ncbi:MAG: MlaD family protein [Bacteroidota bacterium]|nr:MlaD family protein [Bacteroidota bacterium]
MKISNETKVGILTVVALVILILGFNFLKGKDLFNRSKKIYAIFKRLGPLEKSNMVKINGITIGAVYEIEPVDKDISSVKVTISLSRDVNIPVNSVAYISPGLVGSSTLVIEKGSDSTHFLKDGDELQTRKETDILGDISSEVSPTLAKIRQSLDSLNKVFGNINRLFDAGTKGNMQQAIANMTAATASLNKMLDPETSALAGILRNASSITENLKKNNDSITMTISNAKQFSEKLAKLNLQQTVDTLEAAISQIKATVSKLSGTDGTLGALIHDKKLYNKLNDVALSMEILLDDLRTHPKRYVNFSIFGKKDKGGALDSPSTKKETPHK